MKTIFKISTIAVLLLTSILNANEILPDRGGKFGTKLPTSIGEPINIPSDITKKRSSCYTNIWSQAYLKARWQKYIFLDFRKVKAYAYAYTNLTYGSSIKSCNIPYKAKKLKIRLISTDRWSYPEAVRYNTLKEMKSTRLLNSNYISANGELQRIIGFDIGKNIISVHTTELGWYTFNQSLLIEWN